MPPIQRRAASRLRLASSLVVERVVRGRRGSGHRLLPVAVMGLVVDDHHVRHRHQLRHHPLQHLALRFERLRHVAGAPLQKLPAAPGQLEALAQLERVVVGDDDAGAVQVVQHVGRNQLTTAVVALGIVRVQHAKPITDREARCDDEKATGKALAARVPHRVDRLPSDQHRHHGRLAGAGGELQAEAGETGVRFGVRRGEELDKALGLLAELRRALRSARSRSRRPRSGRRTAGRR